MLVPQAQRGRRMSRRIIRNDKIEGMALQTLQGDALVRHAELTISAHSTPASLYALSLTLPALLWSAYCGPSAHRRVFVNSPTAFRPAGVQQ